MDIETNGSAGAAGPGRWKLGPLEVVLRRCPDFESEVAGDARGGREHPGLAVAAWNQEVTRTLQRVFRSPCLDALVSEIRRWNNPNTIIVPHSDGGYTELHAMLASACPDEVLRRYKIERRDVSVGLWPFSVPKPRRAAFATAAEGAFADFMWLRLMKRGSRPDLDEHASARLVMQDAGFWMGLMYQATINRADQLPRPPRPPEETAERVLHEPEEG